jgi:small-conductance mechanosensitive channel
VTHETSEVRAPASVLAGIPRVVPAFIFLILVQLVIAQSLNLYPRVPMIDFYQYWGVAAARRLSSELGTPYSDPSRYRAALADYAARSGQPKIERLKPPAFTATPFAYMLFSAFPADYSRSTLLFHTLQLLCFLGGVIMLGRLYRYPLAAVVCLAFLLVLGSGPLSSDLRLGNLGCFQLFALAVILAVLDRSGQASRPAVSAATTLVGLTVLVLIKPSVMLIVTILALNLLLTHGIRLFGIAMLPALVCAAVAVMAPCLYFGSWHVWNEWYGAVLGADPYRLAVDPASGNYSTTRMLSLWINADVWLVTALLAGAAIVSLTAVVAASRTAGAAPHGVGFSRALRDPHLAMAIGVTITTALSPLFWYHYYVMILIPGLWLLNAPEGPGYPSLWGLAALMLGSGLLNVLFIPLGWTGAVAAGAALCWVPLWIGILLRLRPAGRGAATEVSA